MSLERLYASSQVLWLFLEVPLQRMAFVCETTHPNFFEDADGAEIIVKALSSDHLDTGHLKLWGQYLRTGGLLPAPF